MAKRMRTAKTTSEGSDRDAALHDLAISPLLQEVVAANDSADATAGDEKVIRAAATRSRGAAAAGLNSTASAAAHAGEAAAAMAKGKRIDHVLTDDVCTGAATTANGSADNKHVMLPAFLSKTFEIFSMQEFSNICGWNASGDTIIVSQLEAFVAMVLPRFFKHRNFPSFVRQLNLYGFHKTVLDSKRLEFQHPYFKRDRPDLLHYIKRKVSSGNSSTHQQQQQQIVNSSIQNSRLEAHREISDNLLREMKELRQRSEAMEKRLRELEIDNAIVRSDNIKLWKHLETAKDKQLIMQEKLKKIMWILFQIYRGKQGIPKLSSNDSTSVITEDMLGPKEFREVLRYLAMDEPPLLPRSSNDVEVSSQGSRKRKFVEVPSDGSDQFADSLYKIEVSSPITTANSSAMTVASNPPPTTTAADSTNNVLSLFSPSPTAPRTEFANSDFNALMTNAMSSTLANYGNNSAETSARENNTTSNSSGESGTAGAANQLDFIDDELPLLSDSETYNFGEGEEVSYLTLFHS
ncbi:Heat shock transcription factor, other eukaryote, partial [Globisporangium splendens]